MEYVLIDINEEEKGPNTTAVVAVSDSIAKLKEYAQRVVNGLDLEVTLNWSDLTSNQTYLIANYSSAERFEIYPVVKV